jgi:hypothetical protein
MVGSFIAVFLGVSGLVYLNYPDRVAYPREFENGLERELGGPGAVRVSGILSDEYKLDLARADTGAAGANGW